MTKETNYQSRQPDDKGLIAWSPEENLVWTELYARQRPLIEKRACEQYLKGMELLKLPKDGIPQLPDIDKVLMANTGWKTAAVPALINFGEFFSPLFGLIPPYLLPFLRSSLFLFAGSNL